jgi:hypothetical protein
MDIDLLIMGAVVFTLLVVGLGFTILEFREIKEK